MRIAQVAASDMSIRFLLWNQVLSLQHAGFEMTVVCNDGPWAAEARARGARVRAVPMERELSPLRDIATLKALVRLFREERFDVVHTHTPKAGLIGPFAARLARVPHVVHTVHGLLFHDRMPIPRRAPFVVAEAVTAGMVHHLLFQSREDMDVARRWHLTRPGKMHYQGNGIEVKRFDPSQVTLDRRKALRAKWGFADGAFVVGMVGRLVREKGYEEFLTAAEALIERLPDVRFVVVGPAEPDQRDSIDVERRASAGLRARLRSLGMRLDMADIYGAMDVFVLPSHREGIPRALMEASAMALPVVASDIRGCREVVAHGTSGLLVPVRDATALAVAIESLAGRRDQVRAMGAAGRARILADFDEEQVVDRLIAFYRTLVS